ncbi:MAG: chorismate mutase [Candidatus Margulisiibacteriota bacterium]
MKVRGIRGAIVVKENSRDEILARTERLISEIIAQNKMVIEDIASAVFSVTSDLDAEFPALAARKLGWTEVPLLCTNEIPVKGSLKKCIRVLVLINSDLSQSEIKHVYLDGAEALRKDYQK